MGAGQLGAKLEEQQYLERSTTSHVSVVAVSAAHSCSEAGWCKPTAWKVEGLLDGEETEESKSYWIPETCCWAVGDEEEESLHSY